MLPTRRLCRHPHSDPRRFHVRATSATTVAIAGDVDVASAAALAVVLADRDLSCVDASAVTFMDAAALAVLLRAHGDRAGGLTLRSPSTRVMRLLALTGNSATLPITSTNRSPQRTR